MSNRGRSAAVFGVFVVLLFLFVCLGPRGFAQHDTKSAREKNDGQLEQLLASKVKAEWDAFKSRNKKAYSDLLSDDFVAVEDDGQGTRNRYHAANEVDQSNINNYDERFFKVFPLGPNATLVTYELTFIFPPKAQLRFKRVYISEIWVRQAADWKLRHYQETSVK